MSGGRTRAPAAPAELKTVARAALAFVGVALGVLSTACGDNTDRAGGGETPPPALSRQVDATLTQQGVSQTAQPVPQSEFRLPPPSLTSEPVPVRPVRP